LCSPISRRALYRGSGLYLITQLPRRRMFPETNGIPAPKTFSRVVVLSLLKDGKYPGLQVPL
jgi:hypothetical protein